MAHRACHTAALSGIAPGSRAVVILPGDNSNAKSRADLDQLDVEASTTRGQYLL